MGAGAPPAPASSVKALNCPNCGAALTIRAFEHTLSVVCVQCLSVLDAKDPNLQVLQQFQERQRVEPLIPLGTRGKWRGDVYEVIGFQVRTVVALETAYSWEEYLLFNPFKGFRYLTQYDGHWNDVKTLRAVPERVMAGGKEAFRLLGRTFVHFATASAETSFVMGEFPWRIRVGEVIAVSDYVAPPEILSAEVTEGETVWSLGDYVDGGQIWQAFSLPGRPPAVQGVFPNQPSPYKGSLKELWLLYAGLMLALLVLALWSFNLQGREEVFSQHYSFAPGRGESSFVTPTFELKGRPSTAELSIHTDLRSDWAYFNFALINEGTGQAYDFGREVSNYPDEGSPNDSTLIPSVPPGRYYLRVEPEMSASGSRRGGVNYELRVRRDVPAVSFFLLVSLFLLIPPALLSFRALGFEKARWEESDTPPTWAKPPSGDDEE
ncbi:MAG: DUF4178 domain-containing protein [Acidobacteria bacterium]|nr:DUF4178 domain-containing protein [Acidobacteriota bacterium]